MMQDLSVCGFNQDANAWCPVRKGDSYYTDALSSLSQSYKTSQANVFCNPLSNGVSGTHGCAALMKALPSGFAQTWTQATFVTSAPSGWPNVANNDFCVKSMITNDLGC